MESKRSSPQQRSSRAARAVRVGLAAVVSLVAAAAMATGCLDRPVAPQEPNTSNIFVDQSVRAGIDRIDLLFMVDNSASMQDKQVLLSRAVPRLLNRLLNPPCVDSATKDPNTGVFVDTPNSDCPPGTEREFSAVPDVHIGVVSSSLGGHGNPAFCEDTPEKNDGGRLIGPATRPSANLVDYAGQGFLCWDNRQAGDRRKPNPPGESNLGKLIGDFQNFVTATGENGCGFEASLEAWYRFLVDPAPPAAIVRTGEITEKQGVDESILAQRKNFLRPDSLVAIIMLTDENDCSIQDSGYGWLAGENQVALGTSACANNPNDKCCTFCGFASAPEGCTPIANDPACAAPKDSARNVRCWDQKRRFGIDFLYPTSRYSTALDSVEICPDSTFPDADCQCRRATELGLACNPGKSIRNPLYADLQNSAAGQDLIPAERDPGLVFLAGIVGVPWQDLATDDSLDPNSASLTYKKTSDPDFDWGLIYGQPDTADSPRVPPGDPLMVESTAPRTDLGPHPIIKIAPASPDAGPRANPINGHEWNPQNQEDLQYACIFDLAPVLEAPRDCNIIGQQTCDCYDPTDDLAGVNLRKKPLCQQDGGAYSSVQVRAKAYPGLRHIDVLRRYGANSIVASICPKVLGDEDSPFYGYNPAVTAIIDRLKEKLAGRCLPRQLSVDPVTGLVPCEIVEALDPTRGVEGIECDVGRVKLNLAETKDQKLDAAVRRAMEKAKKCGPATNLPCNKYTLCKIQQLVGPQGEACKSEPGDIQNTFGYCYIDKDQNIGNPELVATCPASEKRILRFVGDNVPATGATVFIACAGDTFSRAAATVDTSNVQP